MIHKTSVKIEQPLNPKASTRYDIPKAQKDSDKNTPLV